MTEANHITGLQPPVVYLQRSKALEMVMDDAKQLLKASASSSAPCRELVMGVPGPGYIEVKDASVHGVGGVIVGHTKACTPTVFLTRMA